MNYPTNLYNDLFSAFYSKISSTDFLDIDDKIGAYASEVADCAFKKGFQLAVALFTAK